MRVAVPSMRGPLKSNNTTTCAVAVLPAGSASVMVKSFTPSVPPVAGMVGVLEPGLTHRAEEDDAGEIGHGEGG